MGGVVNNCECSDHGQILTLLNISVQERYRSLRHPMDYLTVRPVSISYGGGLRVETHHNQNVRQLGTAGLNNLMHTDTRLKGHVQGNKASKAYGFPLLLISELKGIL